MRERNGRSYGQVKHARGLSAHWVPGKSGMPGAFREICRFCSADSSTELWVVNQKMKERK
jgi:hypothetical protein